MSKAELLEKAKTECEIDKSLIIDPEFPQLVYGKGDINATILFIGEAPGKNEALVGLPFVGAAGKNFDKLLSSINLTLEQCYVANILKYRPPKNRLPKSDEMQRHIPYLLKQISIIKPKIIVTLGNISTKLALSNFSVSVYEKTKNKIGTVSKLHGKNYQISLGKNSFVLIPLYHPAASIHNIKLRKTLRDDFQIIQSYCLK